MDGDKTKSDNYRCITLSPAISKLFEMVLLQLFHKQLHPDNLNLVLNVNPVVAMQYLL